MSSVAFAEKCRKALVAARAPGATTVPTDKWLQVIQGCFDAETTEARKPSRKRNALFDALAEASGANPAALTRSGATRVATALSEIKEASPDVTPEQISAAAAKYRRLHPTWEATATAFSAHWGEISDGGGRTERQKRDPYQEPPLWRPVAHGLWPDAEIHNLPWSEVSLTCRIAIIERIPQ